MSGDSWTARVLVKHRFVVRAAVALLAAIELVDFRPKLSAKLPANLQSDLKTLVNLLFTRIQGDLAKATSHAGA